MTMIGYSGYECPDTYDWTHETVKEYEDFTEDGRIYVTRITTYWNGSEAVDFEEDGFFLNYNRPQLPH